MQDVFGNNLEIGTEVMFMQVGYRFFGIGQIENITPKTCVINFQGQKVRQFPSQVINIEEIYRDKSKLARIQSALLNNHSDKQKVDLIRTIVY